MKASRPTRNIGTSPAPFLIMRVASVPEPTSLVLIALGVPAKDIAVFHHVARTL
jgi:hypothetical protein